MIFLALIFLMPPYKAVPSWGLVKDLLWFSVFTKALVENEAATCCHTDLQRGVVKRSSHPNTAAVFWTKTVIGKFLKKKIIIKKCWTQRSQKSSKPPAQEFTGLLKFITSICRGGRLQWMDVVRTQCASAHTSSVCVCVTQGLSGGILAPRFGSCLFLPCKPRWT